MDMFEMFVPPILFTVFVLPPAVIIGWWWLNQCLEVAHYLGLL